MADADLYDTDILAWSEQQAAVLRALADGRIDEPAQDVFRHLPGGSG